MARNRMILGSIICVVLGALVIFVSRFVGEPSIASSQVGVAVGVGLSLLALIPLGFLLRSTKQDPIDTLQERLEFEKSARQATQELLRQTEILQKRERQLADRFLQYQAWMEYPLEDEGSPTSDDANLGEESTQPTEQRSSTNDRHDQDRALKSLLEREAERVFNQVKENAYTVEGRFDIELVRDDLKHLVISVARIYHPESANPLLETSLEQLLRAASRTCLQLMVLVERLPINLSEFSLQSLYSYLRRGLRAYQVYQNVRPVLPYLHYASYAGRFMLGVNPIALGTQWALWTLGSKGAQAATRHIVNRQALSFLHDSITTIGYEVASVFDPDLRHRDRHWIFGVELTELLSRFPLTRESLVRAFGEIGNLPLRSEYDRVFLYRTIAAHRSGGPNRFTPREKLAPQDRQWIAKRLASFANRHLAQRDLKRIEQWQTECQKRLGVAIAVNSDLQTHSDQEQLRAAVESLAEFLLVERQQDFDDLDKLLNRTQLFRQINRAESTELLAKIQADPPSIYELPDLDPQSDIVPTFITDMARLTAATAWQVGGSLDAIEWAGEYFQISEDKLRSYLREGYQAKLHEIEVSPSMLRKLSAKQMMSILEIVPPDASIEILYMNPKVDWGNGTHQAKQFGGSSRLLVGWAKRLVLIQIEGEVGWIWSNDQPAEASIEKNFLQTTLLIRGGEWHCEEPHPSGIRLTKSLASRQDNYFEILQRIVQNDD